MLKISVVVSQFLEFYQQQPRGMQMWVDDINLVLKERNQVKVFICVENTKAFSAKNSTKAISNYAYNKIHGFEDPISIKMYMSFLRDHPNLVIIHALPHFTTAAATIIYGLKKIPIIVLVHGIYSREGLVNKIRNFFVELSVKKYADHVVALTSYDKRLLIKEYGFNERKIAIIPLGLSHESRRAIELWKQKVVKKNTSFTYLFVGRLIKEKRAGMLIDAFNEMLKATNNAIPVQLIIAGDGPEYGNLQLKVHDYKIDSFVKFLGWVKREEIWKYYLQTNVVVLPSEIEGFPYTIHEAFACGKPVIASNITGISEIVQHEMNGLLFNDKEELTLCLRKVLNDNKLLNYLGENAAETAKKFDIFLAVQNLAKITGLDLV